LPGRAFILSKSRKIQRSLDPKELKESYSIGPQGRMVLFCRRMSYQKGPDLLVNAIPFILEKHRDIMVISRLHSQRNEPFGIIILEAWDAVKPKVATEAVSVVKNFTDGLLAYVQPESIARCINRLLDNPNKIKKYGFAGQRRIEAELAGTG
jgi:glycosyltransferase involved in cell wall biosynthesis